MIWFPPTPPALVATSYFGPAQQAMMKLRALAGTWKLHEPGVPEGLSAVFTVGPQEALKQTNKGFTVDFAIDDHLRHVDATIRTEEKTTTVLQAREMVGNVLSFEFSRTDAPAGQYYPDGLRIEFVDDHRFIEHWHFSDKSEVDISFTR